VKTNICLWSCLAEFFLDWRVFKTKVHRKSKHAYCVQLLPPPPKIVPFLDNVGKCCRAGQATDDNMAHAHCMLDPWSHKHTFVICNTYCFSRATTVGRTWLNVTLYVHWQSFLNVSVAVVPMDNVTVCCNNNRNKSRHTILCSETDIR
jgi:hypothetical protein